ncbi:MAG TPA: glucose-1-phosphate adenylyltransferase [Saprospiraceae bacterium]|nr:glucose-1-phosphate adenylyltransferase [Saprospiraceae bacterium]
MALIKMISLILGGGAGTRLYPLTKSRSKPAVSIGGKYRLIDIPISNCLNSGVKRMFVLTQYNSASLNKHIKNTFQFDKFTHAFVDILAAEQTAKNDQWFQGTADAVRKSMHHLKNHDYDYVLILSGDQLYQMDFEKMAEFHIANKAELTIATIPVNAQDATGFGIMKINDDNQISSFVEKPSAEVLNDWVSPMSESNKSKGKLFLASMGIYIFNRNSLEALFDEYPNADDFGKQIIPAAIQNQRKVVSYQYEGYWTDIGNIRSFFEANLELTDDVPKFNLFDNSRMIYTRARMLPPSKIFGSKIDHSIISEGAIIHAESIQRSVIGIRSRIGYNTKIRATILMGNDYFETIEDIYKNKDGIIMGIGNDCYIENAIIDKNARIGSNVTIKGNSTMANCEEENYCIVEGIVVVKKNAVIPSGTVIGEK